jgi:nicotinamidase-related amidase
MKMPLKNDFLEKSRTTLGEIYDRLERAPIVSLRDLPEKRTALIVVDMINAFAREGALHSPRTAALIPAIVELMEKSRARGIPRVVLTDSHSRSSAEFKTYPEHAVTGTREAEIVDEIKTAGGYIQIAKNSTNSFHEAEFQNWLRQNPALNNFVVCGVCTDICILQFSLTLLTWFNEKNSAARLIVPVNGVDSYDLGCHDADLMNVMALYNMQLNGVEVVKEVR